MEQAPVAEGVWIWQYSKGEFEVHFAAGNEFVCPAYPAHAHWKVVLGNKVLVSWGRYGDYDMTLSLDGRSMEGSYLGSAKDWRKANFVRPHTEEETQDFADAAAHSHTHEHEHHDHSTCSHHH
jgi:ABC-type nickel/cobalt efflux system permease component RcnA